MKVRYDVSIDSTLIFISDGNKLSIFEFIRSNKTFSEIYNLKMIKPEDKIVGIEVLDKE